jgi:hypothetical protein
MYKMIRRSIMLALVMVLGLMVFGVEAQILSYGQTGFGALVQKYQSPMFAGYTSVGQSLLSDSSSGVSVISREGVFYSDADSTQTELKGVFIHAAVRYNFELAKVNCYLETGGKVQMISEDGQDNVGSAMGLALGLKLYKSLGVQATGDWLPGEGPDRYLLSFAIDLFPDL